jgi:hypothetical protein
MEEIEPLHGKECSKNRRSRTGDFSRQVPAVAEAGNPAGFFLMVSQILKQVPSPLAGGGDDFLRMHLYCLKYFFVI